MSKDSSTDRPFLPPRWFIRSFWVVHRSLVRRSKGRRWLRSARPDRWGMVQLTTTGRRSGQPRSVIVGYLDDGPDVVTLAMNGWDAPEPAWWLNLQAEPRATIADKGGSRPVRAHTATGAERDRLWARWRAVDPKLDAYAAMRPTPTAVVVLSPDH